MFNFGVTKTVISARVENRMGSGQVELEEQKMDDSSQLIAHRTGKIVNVFSIHGTEIPADKNVSLALVDGQWNILKFDK